MANETEKKGFAHLIGYIKTEINSAKELPAVTASDNGKFVCVVNGAYALHTVPSAESNSFGGGA